MLRAWVLVIITLYQVLLMMKNTWGCFTETYGKSDG